MNRILIAVVGLVLVASGYVLTIKDNENTDPQHSLISSESSSGMSFTLADNTTTKTHRIISRWRKSEQQVANNSWQLNGVSGFDYDNDGDIDLYLSQHSNQGGKLLENLLIPTGKLAFKDVARKDENFNDLPGAEDKPWFFDFNGDGYIDIAGLSNAQQTPYTFNQSAQGFEPSSNHQGYIPLAYPVEVNDYNGDGYLDLHGGNKGIWYFDNEKQIFSHQQVNGLAPPKNLPEQFLPITTLSLTGQKQAKNPPKLTNNYYQYFVNNQENQGFSTNPIDLNHDGLTDLIVTPTNANNSQEVTVPEGQYYVQNKQGLLQPSAEQLKLPLQGSPIYFGDLNNDDLDDLIIAGSMQSGVYLQTNDGFRLEQSEINSFIAIAEEEDNSVTVYRAYPEDFDHDGDIDIVITNVLAEISSVFENNGDGRFTQVLEFKTWRANPILLTDINNDGKTDIIAGGGREDFDSNILIYLNNTKIINNFVVIFPRNELPNPYAVGALVEVFSRVNVRKTSKGRTLVAVKKARWDGQPLAISTPDISKVDIAITYPNQKKVMYKNLATNKAYSLFANGLIVNGYKSPVQSNKKAVLKTAQTTE